MRPRRIILILEDVANSLRRPLSRKGSLLSENDSDTVVEVYILWLCLICDLGYLPPETLKRDSTRLLSDMLDKDVYDLNGVFSELALKVIWRDVTGFKGLCKRISSHLYHLIGADVERLSLSDVDSAKKLLQVFSFTSRLSLRDLDLSAQCLEDYCRYEANMAIHFDDSLILPLNNIIKRWVEPFDPTRLQFRHGPGKVSGISGNALDKKYLDLGSDPLIDYVFGDSFLKEHSERIDRLTEVMFVPKSYKTFRTISAEPATLMYLQQGILHEIDRIVQENRYLRYHIDTHDSTRNSRLAMIGSRDRSYATLDLSAASDSVSYALVKRLFKGTKLLKYLMATRSRWALLPDGSRMPLKKFAPMGSAVCFPVETLIFASICEHVTRCAGVVGRYSVYGDDMIVPTECAHEVANILSQLGFTLNRDKSYYHRDCWFRESCGAECIDGVDVTPLRISRKYVVDPVVTRNGVDHISSSAMQYYSLANTASEYGFTVLRSFLIRKIFVTGLKPLFGDTSLYSEEDSNYHLKKRWGKRYQRIEVLSSQLKTIYSKGNQRMALRHWLESTKDRIPKSNSSLWTHVDIQEFLTPDTFVSYAGRASSEFVDRWVQKPLHWSDEPVDAFVQACLQTGKGKDL